MSQAAEPLQAPVPVWFEAPVGFNEIPLGEDPKQRAGRMGELLDSLYPEAPFEEKLALVATSELMLHGLLEGGAIHVSSFMYRLDHDQVCSGTVVVSMEEKNLRPLDTFVERTLLSASSSYPEEELDTGAIDLPCGPAVLVTRDVAGPSLASALHPEEQSAPEVSRQLEVCIPFPNGSSLLKVCFTTPDLDAWEELFPAFGKFLTGISFTAPSPPKTARDVERQQAADEWARDEFG